MTTSKPSPKACPSAPCPDRRLNQSLDARKPSPKACASLPGPSRRLNQDLDARKPPPRVYASLRHAELQATSNFSFLRGASHPEELVERAAALGWQALALTDRNTLAGVVRAHLAAKRAGLRFLPGARLDLIDAPSLLCLPTTRAAYGRLARLLTLGRRRAPKGQCRLERADLPSAAKGQIFVAVASESASPDAAVPPDAAASPSSMPPSRRRRAPEVAFAPGSPFARHLEWCRDRLDAPLYLAATHLLRGDDDRRLACLASLSQALGVPLAATGSVEMHDPRRRRLHDVLACVREGRTIDDAGRRLAPNAERHLKPPSEVARLLRRHPEALANAAAVAEQCRFSLDEIRYEYPAEVVPGGGTPQERLETLAREGAESRWPEGIPAKVRAALKHELALIGKLNYAPYFLTVDDIVRTARERGILCQGRGSAANSVVCYCLGITSVDPTRIDLLFERFVSAERDEAPDIDVDFEHERREEIIQYIYRKHGRDRAGLAATVVSYRPRSALRDVGKAMGLSQDVIGRLLSMVSWWSGPAGEEQAREQGFDPADRRLRLALELARELCGFPRHLSQHTGGFVISRTPLCEIVPVQNAAMPDRTVIEWNKDDLEALGLIKVDVLGLGMLSCIRRAFGLLEAHHGVRHTMASVPQEDPAVYEMIQRADTVGVFQIESRAQMAMLPRLRPKTFYDLVIEVAIVRPGPIQGDMVHPYLRRRQGLEPVRYPSEELRQTLEKTLGVPLFQEQAMKIAIVAAGFSASEADQLRRAMASFRNYGTVHRFRDKFVRGMTRRGYDPAFAESCFRQIEGFGDYGFPESHAASFALLVYVSSWIKRRYPAIFACALINSQPMGFYAPAQIVRDAREHGVEVRPSDVNHSEWDATLEPADRTARSESADRTARGESASRTARSEPAEEERFALRLGLSRVRGLREEDAARLVAAREEAPGGAYLSPEDLWRRSGISRAALVRLANADAMRSMGLDRRQAAWAAKALEAGGPLPLFENSDRRGPGAQSGDGTEIEPALPAMSASEHVVADHRTTGLSLKQHLVAFLRERLARRGVRPASDLSGLPGGARVAVAGLVLVRQRPGSGKVMFVTLEDETGVANLVVLPAVRERWRRELLTARLMICHGKVQAQDGVIHVVAKKIEERNAWLAGLSPAQPGGGEAFVGRGRFFH